MTPANELDNPPFDPTPVEVAEPVNSAQRFTILVRGPVTSTAGVYPETGQSVSAIEYPGFKESFWESLFGPTKATLRRRLDAVTAGRDDEASKNIALLKSTEILKKQVSIWEKTYTTVSELAQQRIQDVAMLRQNLNAANEEIERLCMAPQPTTLSKAPRKKKLQPQGNRKC